MEANNNQDYGDQDEDDDVDDGNDDYEFDCDKCDALLKGSSYSCKNPGCDYDLCWGCYKETLKIEGKF